MKYNCTGAVKIEKSGKLDIDHVDLVEDKDIKNVKILNSMHVYLKASCQVKANFKQPYLPFKPKNKYLKNDMKS